MPDGLAQIEHLLARRIATIADAAGDLSQWWEYMREDRPEALNEYLHQLAEETKASSELLHVLELWVRRQNRHDCRAWLLGESLSEAKLRELGVFDQSREDHETLELQSRSIVIALCRLASPTMSLALCFDQIEALQVTCNDGSGLREFASMVRALHDETQHLAIITSIQSHYLLQAREEIQPYARDAMDSFCSESLQPLKADEAAEIVTARLNDSEQIDTVRPKSAGPTWPFTLNEIQNWTGTAGCSPRQLINFCKGRFRELQGKSLPKPVTVEEGLRNVWEQRWEVATQENTQALTEQILADGLPLLLDVAAPGWSLSEDPKEQDLEFILEAPNEEARIGISFCTQGHMTSLAGRLRRLQDRYEKNDLQKLVMLRDSRATISKNAVKTRDYLSQLTDSKEGVLLKPTAEAMAALDALRGLFGDAQSGDLAIDGKPVGVDSLREWMLQHLADPLQEFCEKLISYQGVGRWTEIDELHDGVVEILQEQHVVGLQATAKKLNCSIERLEKLTEHAESAIGLIRGENSVLFEIVGS